LHLFTAQESSAFLQKPYTPSEIVEAVAKLFAVLPS
jgi:hypothetical protein